MAENFLTSTGYIAGVNWNMEKNSITLKTFKSVCLKRVKDDIKIEFFDERRKKCQLCLKSFNQLCDLRDSIMQITSLLKENEHQTEQQQPTPVEQPTNTMSLLESLLKIEYAKALIANLPSIQNINCLGCQSVQSQAHECCFAFPIEQKLHLWFDDLLALVNEEHVIQECIKLSETLECINMQLQCDFKTKVMDNDWRIQMKTPVWKKALLETTIRLLHLESRFQ